MWDNLGKIRKDFILMDSITSFFLLALSTRLSNIAEEFIKGEVVAVQVPDLTR